MRLCLQACIAAVALYAVLPGQARAAAGESAPVDATLSQFESLLQHPDEIATNLAYAAGLQAAGHTAEARQVYLKVLSLDPNNATAKAALAATAGPAAPTAGGAQTDFTLRFGGAYESNSPRRPPLYRSYEDGEGFGELTVNDTRRLGDLTLQSNFDVYSDIHDRYTAGDITYLTVDTGPVFDLNGAGKLRVAAGGEYLLQGQSPMPPDYGHILQFEFDSGNAIFNWHPPGQTPLNSVNLLVGYDNFRKSDSYRSGVVMRLTAPFVFEDVLPATHTRLLVTPGFVYDGASQPSVVPALQPAHYAEADLDVLTLTPLAERALGAERVVAKLGVFTDAQYYTSHDPIPTNDREDVRLIPLAGVRLVGFLWPSVQLDLDYRYDRNLSNDGAQRFEDHIVSLITTLRF